MKSHELSSEMNSQTTPQDSYYPQDYHDNQEDEVVPYLGRIRQSCDGWGDEVSPRGFQETGSVADSARPPCSVSLVPHSIRAEKRWYGQSHRYLKE